MKFIRDKMEKLEKLSKKVRRRVVQMVYDAKGGHIGGDLSCVDVLVNLYFNAIKHNPQMPGDVNRDLFIMSKGHSVESYYCVLAEAGYFDSDLLNTYGKFCSPLIGHPTVKIPGIELNSGALGHGLSVGVGMAIAAKRLGKTNRVYVLMGDGEQAEGSIYEAAMAASHYQLDNLVAIIDRNGLQISGTTEQVMSLENMEARWQAFGWGVKKLNGNSHNELSGAFAQLPIGKGKPSMIIAQTIKGCGVSFMENRPEWHHKVPSEQQLEMALAELS